MSLKVSEQQLVMNVMRNDRYPRLVFARSIDCSLIFGPEDCRCARTNTFN